MNEDWNELNALRGLSPRQQRLLNLEALVEGTGYDDLEAWDATTTQGVPLPCCKRKPSVQIGILVEKVAKLTRRLSGKSSFPAIDGVESIQDELDELRLKRVLPLPTRDLLVKGSAALGFARLGSAASGRFEALYLESEWCEPIFVAKAGGERAEQVAAELSALGVPLTPPADGDFLFAPPDADSHDVCFVRYEWIVDEELAGTEYGTPRETKRTRHRRDYLPNAIVEYKPVEILEGDEKAPEWQLAGKPRPHNWGVVPVVWARSPMAKPGDVDGPSFLSPEIRSISTAADYTESLANDSVKKIAWPQLALIDLKDKVAEVNRELNPLLPQPSPTSSSAEVMEFKSSHQTQQGKAQILEINGAGPKVAAEHVERLQAHADRLTGLVEFDQGEAAGTLSGVALERMMEPLISTVDEWRGPLEDMLVLLCRKLAHVLGQEVDPVVRWPRVIAVTPADLAAAATALSTATGGQPVMSQETGAKLFAQLAEIEDADEELKRLAGDADEAMERAKKMLSKAPAEQPKDKAESKPARP